MGARVGLGFGVKENHKPDKELTRQSINLI